MAPTTRTSDRTQEQVGEEGYLSDLSPIFAHMCYDIAGLKNDSPTILALKENMIFDIDVLNMLTKNDIDEIKYTETGKERLLFPGLRVHLTSLVSWYRHVTTENAGILLTEEEWKKKTSVDYKTYTANYISLGMPVRVEITGTRTTTHQQTGRVVDPVAEFKKGTRRDASLYPTLKDNNHWNNWNRSVLAQAQAHDLKEVFNMEYVPVTVEEIKLFDEKQCFAYALLNRIVQTDEGKSFVRQHEKDYNAQEVYRKLLNFATKSTSAELAKDGLIKFLTTTQLDSRWTGTTVGFILHWCEQMRLLDDMSTYEDRFRDNVQKRMMEQAVENIPELATVKDIDTNRAATGGTVMTYSQYKETLIAAATRRDERLKPASSRTRRVVQTTTNDYGGRNSNWFDQGYLDAGENYYNFEGTFDEKCTEINRLIQANVKDKVENSNRIPKELWDKLTPELQADFREWNRKKAFQYRQNKDHQRIANSHNLIRYPGVDYTLWDDTPDDRATDGIPIDGDTSDEGMPGCEQDSTAIMAHITKQKILPASHNIRSILASAHKRTDVNDHLQTQDNGPQASKSSVLIDGRRYVQADKHEVLYRVANLENSSGRVSSLIDRGANGGLAGEDVRIIETTGRTADVSGINDHTIRDLPIATVAGVVQSHLGPICIIMHQYAYHGKGKTIHSCVQVEHHGNEVNDRSLKVKGGKQCITTLEGYAIPLQVRGGLTYMDMYPPSDDELNKLPHVVFTSDADWDPYIADNDLPLEEWLDALMDKELLPGVNDYGDLIFDDQGYYRSDTILANKLESFDTTNLCDRDNIIDKLENKYRMNNIHASSNDPDFETLRPRFAWLPIDIIKKTFDVTTRWARSIEHLPFRKHFKSRFPAFNVHRRNEPVATDTVYSDTLAVDSGATSAQIFVGTQTLVTDVYGMKTDKEFVLTLQDNIRKRGAMDKLISDRAQTEISHKVLDILRNYIIDDWQSEPYHEHQNPAERRYQTIKTYTNKLLDRTGAPATTWLLALQYNCYLFNHVASETLGWQTPLQQLTGVTTDISALLYFTFWEPVYYATGDSMKYEGKPGFPSETSEARGRFVGFGESVGDILTYKVLSDDTNKILFRSYVRSAIPDGEPNKRLDSTEGEPKPIVEFVKSPRSTKGEPDRISMITFKPDDLISRTYLTEPDENGQRFRAKIVRKIVENAEALQERPEHVKFLVSVEGNKADEIVAYNDILSYLEETMSNDNTQPTWRFKDIIAHEGPLTPTSPSWKGSPYNVMVLWEDGSRTFEPLKTIATESPVVCALYAKRNGLLETTGWKQFNNIAKNEKKLSRMLNQAKLSSFRRTTLYQYGFKVPRTPQEALEFDKENGNSRWKDAMSLETQQLQEYNTFTDLGKDVPPPGGYKKIRVHFVFAIKHDGRHKARLVADGHLTDNPIESVYSGVVTLRSLRVVIFLAELNQLEAWGADVGNAYLEATTREKVYIIGGIGFGKLEGHTLTIYKALYGLKSSGARWHEKLVDSLRMLGFNQSKADSDVWMRRDNDMYEYIAVYTDDLAIVSKNPQTIVDALEKRAGFKLKGVGPIKYHLGCDYTRDTDGTLCCGPKKYIEKMVAAYEQMFGETPKHFSSPLEKNDHPELDDSPELGSDDTTKYQSMIGALQWAVSLGRFDIQTAVMTMSRFRAEPRIGHIERLKRIYGYLRKFKHGAIRVRVGLPDMSSIPDVEHDWMTTVYGRVHELLPPDMPEPLGQEVMTITYEDANLYHDMLTGRAVTGVLHMINGTPVDWYSKRQDTVETATYGSEFVAARIATEQIIDLRTTLRYLGVPIKGKAYMFGDNQSVITSSTLPHSKLSKRHNALSYHRVREAIAAKIINFVHIFGVDNPADVLSKHCGYPQMWPHLQPLLFWMGAPKENNETEIDEENLKEERIEI
jgi:hypothetical protein